MRSIPETTAMSQQGVATNVNINRNGSQRVTPSHSDKELSIAATAYNSHHKILEGIANKVLASFHMMSKSHKKLDHFYCN